MLAMVLWDKVALKGLRDIRLEGCDRKGEISRHALINHIHSRTYIEMHT
jgi:hypothetical protein